jgi:hypothetical protein
VWDFLVVFERDLGFMDPTWETDSLGARLLKGELVTEGTDMTLGVGVTSASGVAGVVDSWCACIISLNALRLSVDGRSIWACYSQYIRKRKRMT